MEVHNYFSSTRKEHPLHLTLLDPGKMSPDDLSNIAQRADTAGTDGIMVGGSTDLSSENVELSVQAIKNVTNLPVILFPSDSGALSGKADAIFFMTLLNSSSLQYIVGEQIASATYIKKLGLETLSMAYLLLEPGMRAGLIGKARLLPRDNPNLVISHALAGQYLGMKYIYLEAGSGAESPVPSEMVEQVRKAVDNTLIVGGGIRTPESAKLLVDSGADIIVTGTFVETSNSLVEDLKPIIDAIHSA